MIAFALAAAAFSRPQPGPVRFEFAEVHMGMRVQVSLYAADRPAAERAARAAFARIAALDAALSDYRSDSEINQLSRTAPAWTPVSAELFAVLARALEIARASDGAFDPTVGPLTKLWREVRRTRRTPEDTEIVAARARVGWRFVELDPTLRRVRLSKPGMQLDLGGIAKGYILQEALVVLEHHESPQALLQAGGDIVVGDVPPGEAGWRVDTIGADASFARQASALARAALATSGPTAQFVEIDGTRYSHVIDPRTGWGVTNGITVSVIAPDGATADALATAIGVLGIANADRLLAAFPGVMVTTHRDVAGGLLPAGSPQG